MALLKAVFDCEVLTPTFLSGSDQRAVEFRAPSVRGAMRYWYRALLGGRGVSDVAELREREAAVFGSTERGSPVAVRLQGPSPADLERAPRIKCHPWFDRDYSGTKYLWYSTALRPNDRRYIPPGTRFRVTLRALAPTEDAAREPLLEAALAFWLLAHLGGLGTRSRRAGGGFEARLAADDSDVSLDDLPAFPSGSAPAFDAALAAGLSAVLGERATGEGRPDFSALAPGFAAVWRANLTGEDAGSAEAAVDAFGRALREYRLRRGKDHKDETGRGLDYHTMKAALRDRVAPPTVERASFGLPLTFRFSSTRGAATVQPDDRDLDRRASPLWARVVRLEPGRYDAVLTHLDSRFLPNGVGMRVSGARGPVAPPSKSLVPGFVSAAFPDAVCLFS